MFFIDQRIYIDRGRSSRSVYFRGSIQLWKERLNSDSQQVHQYQ